MVQCSQALTRLLACSPGNGAISGAQCWSLLLIYLAFISNYSHVNVTEWKSKNPVVSQSNKAGCLSHLAFCICGNTKEVGSDVSEGMDMLTRGKMNNPFLLPFCLYWLLAENVAQIKCVLTHLWIWMKFVYYSTSRFTSKPVPSFFNIQITSLPSISGL